MLVQRANTLLGVTVDMCYLLVAGDDVAAVSGLLKVDLGIFNISPSIMKCEEIVRHDL